MLLNEAPGVNKMLISYSYLVHKLLKWKILALIEDYYVPWVTHRYYIYVCVCVHVCVCIRHIEMFFE